MGLVNKLCLILHWLVKILFLKLFDNQLIQWAADDESFDKL